MRVAYLLSFALFAALPLGTAGFAASTAGPVAQAEIKDAKGMSVGTASFLAAPGGVTVLVDVKGLAAGEHGIHFHEHGKCDGPDFKTSGGHLNPTHKDHGLSNPNGPHAGDLPNLTVGADGTGHAKFTTDRVTLGSGDNSLLKDGGVAIVIHAKADDQKSNPAGESGDRIACGVIGKAQ